MTHVFSDGSGSLKEDRRQPAFVAFCVALFIYPYLFPMTMFFPLSTPFGKSLYIAGVTSVLLVLVLTRLSKLILSWGYVLAAVCLLSGVVFGLRLILYEQPVASVFAFRAPIMTLFYAALAALLTRDRADRELLWKVVVFNSFLQALLGIIHYHFFPTLYFNLDLELTGGKPYLIVDDQMGATREGGTLGNASVYANFVLVGMYLLLSRAGTLRKPAERIASLGMVLVMLFGIVISGSRYPLLIAVVVLGIFSWRYLPLRVAAVLWGLVALIAVSFAWTLLLVAMERMHTEGDGSRMVKTMLAISLSTADLKTLLIGVENDIVANAETADHFRISDNSYITILLGYGLPFLLLWIGALVYAVRKSAALDGHKLYLVYFFVGLALTNCVLWDVWLLTYFAGLFCLERELLPTERARALPAYGAGQPAHRDSPA